MNYTEMSRPLYKRDTTGNVRVWTMESGWDDDHIAGHRSHTGVKDGAVVTSEWKIASPKNIGKVNATNALEQAVAEIAALYVQKLDRGYFEDESDIDNFDKFKPMLAAKYEDVPLNFEADGRGNEIYSQPKLDGIRCIARKDGLWSREGKVIVSCPHVEAELKPFFDKYPGAVIDGELYNHELKNDFNKITSLVRKSKLKLEDYQESALLVQYHVYDCYMDDTFDNRFSFLWGCGLQTPVVYVKTTQVNSQKELDDLYDGYVEAGYEGQMVRLNREYQSKRSKFLLKRKEFVTEEFQVISTEEGQGNWSGHIKRFIIKLGSGNICGAGVRGNQATMKALFESGDTPDWATVRYFNLTPDGVPRFPVVIDWGKGQRED
jgi:DNA ligase-1